MAILENRVTNLEEQLEAMKGSTPGSVADDSPTCPDISQTQTGIDTI